MALLLCGCTTPATIPTADEMQRLRASRFVLLGEVHDNAEQHRQRAALLSVLLTDGRPTTIVFEQMGRDQDAAIGAAPREAEAIADAGRLDRRAWGWPLHKPLVEAALAASAPIRGGNLEPAEVPAECGVLVATASALEVARPAPKRPVRVGFDLWMALARATPVEGWRLDDAQGCLAHVDASAQAGHGGGAPGPGSAVPG